MYAIELILVQSTYATPSFQITAARQLLLPYLVGILQGSCESAAVHVAACHHKDNCPANFKRSYKHNNCTHMSAVLLTSLDVGSDECDTDELCRSFSAHLSISSMPKLAAACA